MTENKRILKKETIGKGSWLELKNINYLCRKGKIRSWETVERLKCGGAAVMIALAYPSQRLILIRQFRPPAGDFVIEFPAGLINEGEDPEECAVRELQEETGYTGIPKAEFPPTCNSPGLTGETVRIFLLEIDETAPENTNLSTNLDEGEDIETILVPKEELMEFLKSRMDAGDVIDSKVLAFALAGDKFFHASGRNT